MDVTLLVLLLLSVESIGSRKLPSYIDYCHINDPNITECFKKAVEALRPRLEEGIPEFGIPPTNPLRIPQAELDNGNSFKAKFKDIEIYHGDEFILDDIKVDFDNHHLELYMRFPRLRAKGTYDVDGKLLVFQFKGHGPADGNFTNISTKLVIDGTRYEKDGKHYFKYTKSKIDMNLGKPKLRFENIFGDNQELSDRTNQLINENSEELIKELSPIIDQTVIQFIVGLVQRIFERFSIEELFPAK